MSDSKSTTTPASTGSHPSVDTWIAYYARRLPETEAEGLRAHLSGCRRCVDLVLDLDRFAAPSPGDGGVADFEQAAAWRAVKQAVEPPARVQRWTTAVAVAASLVLAVVGFVQYDARLDLESRLAERSRLAANVDIVNLRPGARERSSGGADVTVELAAGGTNTLILNVKDEVDFPGYELRAFDVAGHEAEKVTGLAISDFGNFSLNVPPGALAAGVYELRLFGLDGETEQLIEIYPVEVR